MTLLRIVMTGFTAPLLEIAATSVSRHSTGTRRRFTLPADARPRPLHMSPEHPLRGEMLRERERSLPLRLPLHGGCGRSGGAHLHVHTTYAPKIP